jgi:hypothetical protein
LTESSSPTSRAWRYMLGYRHKTTEVLHESIHKKAA